MYVTTGQFFGVELGPQGRNDAHVAFQIVSRNQPDDYWLCVGGTFSSAYLDDLIDQLQAARAHLQHSCDPDPCGAGYCVRSKAPVTPPCP